MSLEFGFLNSLVKVYTSLSYKFTPLDISGTVEAIGPKVKRVKKGDRVTSFATVVSSNPNPNHGAFQQYTLIEENATAGIPDTMRFKKGTILAIGHSNFGVRIFLNPGIPRSTGTKKQSPVSLSGAPSIKLECRCANRTIVGLHRLRGRQPPSPPREYGASHLFDYNDSNVLTNIANAARASGDIISLASDAIPGMGS
ncbi:MAG: hypothetical protein Q9172_003213 [Xanthocarpia lactea]